MSLDSFFQKLISVFSIKSPLEQKDFLLDAELSYLFLVKGAAIHLQEIETLLREKKYDLAKKKAPQSCLYTMWFVSQVIEKFEQIRLDDPTLDNEKNLGYRIYHITHTYMCSVEKFGIIADATFHNYLVYVLQLTEELIKEVRSTRYKLLL